MQLHSTGEVMTTRRVLVIIGEPGSGKTMLCSTAARDPKKILYVGVDEQGLETLRVNGISVPYVKVDGANPYNSAMALAAELRALKNFPYEAVAIDDGSTLQLALKKWIAKVYKDEIVSKSGKEDPRKLFGKLKDRFVEIVLAFRDLPCHVIWTCWAKDSVTDENGQTVKMGGAMIEGASSEWLEGLANATLLLRIAKVAKPDGKGSCYKRELRTNPFGGYRLKQRLGLPDVIPYDLDASTRPPKWTKGLADVLRWTGKAASATSLKAVK